MKSCYLYLHFWKEIYNQDIPENDIKLQKCNSIYLIFYTLRWMTNNCPT